MITLVSGLDLDLAVRVRTLAGVAVLCSLGRGRGGGRNGVLIRISYATWLHPC